MCVAIMESEVYDFFRKLWGLRKRKPKLDYNQHRDHERRRRNNSEEISNTQIATTPTAPVAIQKVFDNVGMDEMVDIQPDGIATATLATKLA